MLRAPLRGARSASARSVLTLYRCQTVSFRGLEHCPASPKDADAARALDPSERASELCGTPLRGWFRRLSGYMFRQLATRR
jgi:hypothetical protein